MAPGMAKKRSWCHRYLESEFTGFSDPTHAGVEGRKCLVMIFWLIRNRIFKTKTYDEKSRIEQYIRKSV